MGLTPLGDYFIKFLHIVKFLSLKDFLIFKERGEKEKIRCSASAEHSKTFRKASAWPALSRQRAQAGEFAEALSWLRRMSPEHADCAVDIMPAGLGRQIRERPSDRGAKPSDSEAERCLGHNRARPSGRRL